MLTNFTSIRIKYNLNFDCFQIYNAFAQNLIDKNFKQKIFKLYVMPSFI